MRAISLQEATALLQEHGQRYLSMINFLHMNPVEELQEENGAILARFHSDDGTVWSILAADTPEQIRAIQEDLRKHQWFSAIEGWMHPYLAEGRELVWDEPYYTFYVPGHVTFPEQEPLPDIPLEHAATVAKYWTFEGDWTLPYIQSSIERGLSSMKFIDGQPVAWAAIQDDGALGFMHVRSEYRRHGYATEVTFDLIRKYREAGRVPFVHILRTNQASIELAKSVGFELLKEIYWLGVK